MFRKSIYNDQKKSIEFVSKFFTYMKNGRYSIGKNNRFIVRKKIKILNNTFTLFNDKFFRSKTNNFIKKTIYYIVYLCRLLFQKSIIIRDNNYFFQGDILIITNQDKSIKIFNIDDKIVLNKYFVIFDFEKEVENYKFFSQYFNVPEITKISYDESLYFERYIKYKNSNKLIDKEKTKILEDAFIKFNYYYNLIEKKNITYNIPKNVFANYNNINLFEHIICNTSLINQSFPYIKSHGDFVIKNILYSNDKIYYIDFEMSDNNFFLYDIFTFIYYQYYYDSNSIFLKKYFNGDYDDNFNNFFNYFGLSYNPNKRLDYFNIFFIERIIFEEKYGKVDIKKSLEMYDKIIKNLL